MKLKTLITLPLFLLMAGCASFNYTDAPPTMGVMYSKYAYIGYTGELKPIDEVGVVTTDGLILIRSVDGNPVRDLQQFKTSGLYSGGRVQLHLLPGEHVLELGYHDDRGSGTISWSTSNISKTINIKQGQVIHLAVGTNERTWSANERDGSSAIAVITSDFKDLTKPR